MLKVLRTLKRVSLGRLEQYAHESTELLRDVQHLLEAQGQARDAQAQRVAEAQEQQLAFLRGHAEAQEQQFAILRGRTGPLLEAQLEATLLAIRASDPKYADPRRLNGYEFKAFSQFGEDGIVQEVFRRIGTTNRHFVEFGVEAGLENNTAYLLFQGWSGLWIEPVHACVSAIETGLAALVRAGRLKVFEELVTADNVEQLFARAAVPAEPDLLSIDIDGNDYHVWRRIERYRPRVVVIEYNATFPPPGEWVMPYEPGHRWNGTIKFGASLESLVQLGRDKGYALVACSLGGANAFFVRQDLVADYFAAPFTAANHYEPPRYFLLFRQAGHTRSYDVFAA
jgi:hypothetical protein